MVTISSHDSNSPEIRDALVKILEHTIEGIAIIGDGMRIEYVNDRICEIIGQRRDRILGQSFLRFVHPESSGLVMKRFTSRPGGEGTPSTFEARVLRPNDEPRDIEVSATALTNGENKIKILAQVLDVTQERRTLCALSEYAMKYSTLVETMNEGLGIIDDRGVLVYANATLCKMLGYTENDLLGKTTADIMRGYGLDAVSEKIRERIAGIPSRYETHLVHRSGGLIPIMVSASPLHSEEGEYKGSFAVFTDLTTQKRLKRDLETTRNRALLYLDLMSHDLRNHLQEIQVAAELLKYKTYDSSSQDLPDCILRAVSGSTRIISETKTIEELAESALCEKLLDEVLNETVQAAILHFNDVEFNMSIHVSNARIQADNYLEVLLSDLLSHACGHCQEDEKQIWISLAEGQNTYELAVCDNGPGKSDSAKENLFEASRPSGGQHLQLAHFIVEKYAGTIEVLDRVKGDPSQGSKIKVLFPRLA